MEAPPPGAPWWCAAAPRAARRRQWEPPGGRSLVHFDWGKGDMLPGKMRILQMKLMILGNFDDFAREHYWILMRKMKKMMILQENMIISLWTMVILPGNVGKLWRWNFTRGNLRFYWENCDFKWRNLKFTGENIWFDEMWLLLGGHPLFVFSLL